MTAPATGKDFDIVVSYETEDGQPLEYVNFGVSITAHGEDKPLMNMYSETAGSRFEQFPGEGEIRCHIDRCPLPAGQYFIDCWSDIHQQMLDALHRAADLTVAGGDFYGSGREQLGHRTVLVDHSWSLSATGEEEAQEPTPELPVRAADTTPADELRARVDEVAFWWHSIDLGDGIVTPGAKSSTWLEEELARLKLGDLSGKSVLDIGAYDGYYSFAAERLGAERVVAFDQYVWSADMPGYMEYRDQRVAAGLTVEPVEALPEFWRPNELPGRRPFDLAHEALDEPRGGGGRRSSRLRPGEPRHLRHSALPRRPLPRSPSDARTRAPRVRDAPHGDHRDAGGGFPILGQFAPVPVHRGR